MNDTSQDRSKSVPSALADLQAEERRRFTWLSILHDHLTKRQTAEGAKVLEIARQRWLEARNALDRWGADR